MSFKIGDEIEIIGPSRFGNGFLIGSIAKIDSIINHDIYRVCGLKNATKNENWFGYHSESIRKTKRQIRKDKLNILL